MSISRRQAILAGLGVVLGGCSASSKPMAGVARPRPAWIEPPSASTPPRIVAVSRPPVAAPMTPTRAASVAGLGIIPRSHWTRFGPQATQLNPMNGVLRITVHHEGSTPVTFSDPDATAARLESIRAAHTRDRNWADIGYHYIVDRAGRVWQGRDIRFQGAHVKNNNEHNLGILVLGNFDQQAPTDDQVRGLVTTLRTMMTTHRVPLPRVFTHQEINPTACPGRVLQARMANLRSGRTLT